MNGPKWSVLIMVDEASFVEEMFRKNFSKDEKLVIYGLGNNTKNVIYRCPEYRIIGLMDRNRTGEMEWGKNILSIEEVNKLGVKKIVIIATSANVPIIYRRIAKKCKNFDISVFDVNGVLQSTVEKEYVANPFYLSCKFNEVKEAIDACDVVSFDVFDTLLMRDLLYPTDIFELVEDRIKSSFPLDYEFGKIRIKAEMELYKYGNPTILEIYNKIEEVTGTDHKIVTELMAMEIEEERRHIIARSKMIDLVNYAHSNAKIVCCTSDMYLSKAMIRDLLIGCGFEDVFDELYISCEYGKSKNNGLFEVVKEKYDDKRIIHIGDNYDADIKSAEIYGINQTFQLASSLKMLSDSTMGHLLIYDKDLSEKCEIGRLSSHLFNNPFLFSRTKGKGCVESNYNLGYFFIEPIIASFVEWMINLCEKDEIDTLLLGARDGFIIQKILDIRKQYINNNIDYKYFYASRYACTLAGLRTREDVVYAYKMAFDGSPDEMLKKRFALNDDEIDEYDKEQPAESYLERYISLILKKSSVYRDNYRKYIEKCGVRGKRVGFFDFVSSGTCQLWLENIWPDYNWIGYYFVRNLDQYKEKLTIKSFFEPGYVYEKQSKLFKNYIFMENIMTSYEPTVHGFTCDGKVIYKKDNQTELDRKKLSQVHQGILDAYKQRIKSSIGVPSKGMADDILDLLNPKYSIINADFFENNTLFDEFCNRSFDLKTVMKA